MLYTRKKRFDVYRDFFQEPEPFSDILTPEDSPNKAVHSLILLSAFPSHSPNFNDAAMVDDGEEEDDDAMDGFLMNSIAHTVKSMSPPKKAVVPLPVLHFSTSSSIATPVHSTQLAAHTPSSIHLSQFEQPPQGTSTPALGTYLDGLATTPSRPLHYPEPVFRFHSDDLSFDTDASMISGDGLDSVPRTMSSPLTHKSRVTELKDEISSIVDRMKTSIHINTVDGDNDTYMEGDNRIHEISSDFSLPDVSGLSMVPLAECSTSTPKGIMKKRGLEEELMVKVPKKVRINETVDVIVPKTVEFKLKKRPLSSQMDRANRKKTKCKKTNPSYAELLQRSKGEKDPLNLLLG